MQPINRILSACLLSATALLAACDSGSTPSASSAAPISASAVASSSAPAAPASISSGATAQPSASLASSSSGGTKKVVVGSQFEPKVLNGLAPDAVSKSAVDILFDGLVRANQKQELVPRLADKWDISSDGLTYTFHLHPNVKWQDGEPFSADDVVFTYQTLLAQPKGATILPKSDYTGITDVKAPESATVAFTLKTPDASFLSKLQVGILPKHVLATADWATTTFNRQPIGTGPFTLASWQSGQQLVFKANPNYWGGKPGLDEIDWKVIPDANTLAAQLTNGEIDGAGLSVTSTPRFRQDNRFKLYETLGADTYIGFQLDNPTFKDARVRKALAMAIDTDSIVKNVTKGEAIPATSLMNSHNWSYNSALRPYAYDVAAANQLLDQAGWVKNSDGMRSKNGQPLKFEFLTNSEQQERKDVAQIAKQAWHDIGADVDVQFLDLNTFIFERVLKSKFDTMLIAGTVNIDPDYLRRNLATSSIAAGFNFLHYSNPALDTLLDKGVTLTNQNDRKAVYDQAQQLIQDDTALISLYYPKSVYAFKRSVTGVDPTDLNLYWNVEKWSVQ